MLSLELRPELLQDIFPEANNFQSPESHVSYYYYYSNSKTTSSKDDKLKNLSAAAVHTQKFEPNHKRVILKLSDLKSTSINLCKKGNCKFLMATFLIQNDCLTC